MTSFSHEPGGDPVEMVLSKLSGVKARPGGGFQALCPAHADRNPSLSIGLGDDGRALVHCHAGCPAPSVLNAIGLSEADLFPRENRRGNGRRVTARYDYRNEARSLLFQVERMEPKGFRQRRPLQGGEWAYNLNGVRRVLYRLPELIAADPAEPVLTVEGEKDADRLAGLGFVATTSPQGAGKWLAEYSETLRGRVVVIVPDADPAGEAHAAAVADSLCGVAAEVKVLRLPGLLPKGDASDWLDAGNDPDELRRLIAAAPPWAAGSGDTGWRVLEGGRAADGAGNGADAEPPDEPSTGNGTGSSRRPSQATELVALAMGDGIELFHDPNGEPFGTVKIGSHDETWPLRAKGFRAWLAKRFYDEKGRAAGAQAVNDALTVLGGKATFEGPSVPVWVRIAPHDDRLYLDLGDESWRAVAIESGSWQVVDSEDVPVRFRRPKGMLPLPEPDPAGTLSALAPFVNTSPDEPDHYLLVAGWLVGTFSLAGARAILELTGEQGTAKTTLARILRRIVDPCTVPLRTTPRDERDLMIAASNGMIVGYDNLSDIKEWFSDALCRLSTGGGIGGRELYTDLDEIVLDAQRPCVLTGINPVATRSDLLDRTLTVPLVPIPAHERRTEAELWSGFEAAHASILGGLLSAVAASLANRDEIDLPRKPRLADFVAFVEAAAPVLGWEPGEFVAAFEGSRRNADQVAIEALPIGPFVVRLIENLEREGKDEWAGTASALLHVLAGLADEETKRDREWPKRADRLSNQLRRIAPNLRQIGVWVGWDRVGAVGTRRVLLTRNRDAWERQRRQSPADRGGEKGGTVTTDATDAPENLFSDDQPGGVAGFDRWTA